MRHCVCISVAIAALPTIRLRHLRLQEPRKAEAPQLRDECRSYRILAGCRAYPPPLRLRFASLVLTRRLSPFHVSALCSRYTTDIPLRPGRIAQHPRHRSSGPELRGLVRYVWAKVFNQDGVHGGQADGECHSIVLRRR